MMFLCVNRELVELEKDEQDFEAEIQTELAELRGEFEDEYRRKMEQYSLQHEEWRTWRRKQVKAPAGGKAVVSAIFALASLTDTLLPV